MDSQPIQIVREEPPPFWAASVVPFRTLTHWTQPATENVIRVETAEVFWTCPDGWHQSPIFLAMATT